MPPDQGTVITGRPDGDLPLPHGLREILGDGDARTVWSNGAGGITWEVTSDRGRRFAKRAPAGSGLDLAAEAAWLGSTVHPGADRWADLAVATLSTEWNDGPGWTEPLLTAYGVSPDPDRIDSYRLLWDLG